MPLHSKRSNEPRYGKLVGRSDKRVQDIIQATYQGTASGDKLMKVLDKDEKKIYDGLKIHFDIIDCWDIPVPEGWKNIKVAKFDDDT